LLFIRDLNEDNINPDGAFIFPLCFQCPVVKVWPNRYCFLILVELIGWESVIIHLAICMYLLYGNLRGFVLFSHKRFEDNIHPH
jgi:hypothetical protein